MAAANWTGVFVNGSGASVTVGDVIFNDYKEIRVGTQPVFTKTVTGGATKTQIFGNTVGFPVIEIDVAHKVGARLTDGATDKAVVLTYPGGSTETATGRIVDDRGPSINPEGEMVRTVVVQCKTVLAAGS